MTKAILGLILIALLTSAQFHSEWEVSPTNSLCTVSWPFGQFLTRPLLNQGSERAPEISTNRFSYVP